MNIPPFQSRLNNTEDPDCIYDNSSTLKTFDGSLMVKAVSILDKGGDRVNVRFEESLVSRFRPRCRTMSLLRQRIVRLLVM